MLGGFVAGEGCFCTIRLPAFADGSARRRFVFQVTVATRDRALLEQLRSALGYGSITDHPPRQPRHEPTSTLRVSSFRAHRDATIPFADRYLLGSAKRDQFERWRAEMEDYLEAHPSRWGLGPSPCSIPGCGKPVRGRGLCRAHYYRVTGY
jgi:LAGLIDADG endonuclease